MTQRTPQEIRGEAIAWHLRLRDGAPADWDAFVQWLEQDPAHSDAFDAIARADAAITPDAIPLHGQPMPANDDDRDEAPAAVRRIWTRRWATGLAAVAALFLLALVTLPMLGGSADRYEIATAAGQRRSIEIGDGSSAMLNGGTRLILDRNDPRSVELAAGEATFTVRHDDARPFTVVAGEHRVQDVGTRFNLIREPGRFEVAVIEGSVLYDPEGAPVSLAAGQSLIVRAGARPVLARSDPAGFAGWQSGRLSYTAAPLDAVASDLSRFMGGAVRLDPAIRALPFTGSIRIERDHGATITNFAATLGLQARRAGNGWLIEPHGRAPH
jgi:transmembrane sensor